MLEGHDGSGGRGGGGGCRGLTLYPGGPGGGAGRRGAGWLGLWGGGLGDRAGERGGLGGELVYLAQSGLDVVAEGRRAGGDGGGRRRGLAREGWVEAGRRGGLGGGADLGGGVGAGAALLGRLDGAVGDGCLLETGLGLGLEGVGGDGGGERARRPRHGLRRVVGQKVLHHPPERRHAQLLSSTADFLTLCCDGIGSQCWKHVKELMKIAPLTLKRRRCRCSLGFRLTTGFIYFICRQIFLAIHADGAWERRLRQ